MWTLFIIMISVFLAIALFFLFILIRTDRALTNLEKAVDRLEKGEK